MSYSPRKRYARAMHALRLSALFAACVGVCAHVSRAQESAALPAVRLVAALEGYDGPSSFSARAALLSFSPDGRTLAVTGNDKGATAKLFDVETGQLKITLAPPDDETRSILFSPDGRLLLTTSDKSVRLWDAADGKLITTLDRSRFPAHFSPDSRRLVTGGTDKTAYLYEIS